MAASDARPVPRKGTVVRLYFPILDADGDLVSGATGLDSEISKDGATFADMTNEATEIASSSGGYFLDSSTTESDADGLMILVKSTEGKTTPIVLYPESTGDLRVNVEQWRTGTPDALVSGAVVSNPADVVIEAEGSYTIQQALSIILSVVAGETTSSGATILTPDGAATRVAATINSSKERTAMTLTPSA